MGTSMKRSLAVAVLLAALAVLFKLALKPAGTTDESSPGQLASNVATKDSGKTLTADSDPRSLLVAKYQTARTDDRDLVSRVAERFGRNAVTIEQTDGLRGLKLLDRLDIEAILLYRNTPANFAGWATSWAATRQPMCCCTGGNTLG